MRTITEVHLQEISLVDFPAYPLARVISIDGVPYDEHYGPGWTAMKWKAE